MRITIARFAVAFVVVALMSAACASPLEPSENDQTPCADGYKRVDGPTYSECVPR